MSGQLNVSACGTDKILNRLRNTNTNAMRVCTHPRHDERQRVYYTRQERHPTIPYLKKWAYRSLWYHRCSVWLLYDEIPFTMLRLSR